MTTSVTDDQVHDAAKAYYEALHINASWDTQHQSIKDASMKYMRVALESALRSQGKVVEVAKLDSLITYHAGMMVKEENNDVISGMAIVLNDFESLIHASDLTAIIGEGD